jgi:hypothetical protein
MRRASTCLAVLGLALLTFPDMVPAQPTVKVTGRAVPIPGFPHTGNIFGAGAAVRAEVTISGTEYGGFPPPLIGITAYLPAGVKLHPQGFPTCPTKTIVEEKAPEMCPKGSAAGPVGKVYGVVSFGTTRVKESAEVSSFFAPDGGLEFFTAGHTPVVLEVPSSATFTNLDGGAGFGPKLIAQVPLVETVPGAPDASVEAIDITLGAAYRKNGKTVYYGRVPNKCPRGGFPARSELTFAGLGGLSQQTVTVNFKAPCPRK